MNTFKILQQKIVKLLASSGNFMIFYPRYENYTVTVFGSARIKKDSLIYQEVVDFSANLAKLECNIVTGGGPGVMEAANLGAIKGKKSDSSIKSIGINIKLPFEQKENYYLDESFLHKTFFTRLQHFTIVSDCFVAFYGGIGTLLEVLTILQLMQVNKMKGCKLILVGSMWNSLIQWIEDEMLQQTIPAIHSKDLLIPHLVPNFETALEIIEQHKAEYTRLQDKKQLHPISQMLEYKLVTFCYRFNNLYLCLIQLCVLDISL